MQKMLCRSPKGVMMRSEAEIGAWPCDETEIPIRNNESIDLFASPLEMRGNE